MAIFATSMENKEQQDNRQPYMIHVPCSMFSASNKMKKVPAINQEAKCGRVMIPGILLVTTTDVNMIIGILERGANQKH
jgi:hypothetical protein